MNPALLRKSIKDYIRRINKQKTDYEQDVAERGERTKYYRSWTADKILQMSEEDFASYLSRLWAMLIWGNKQYVVDKLIRDNGFKKVKKELADLIWGSKSIEERWDHFRRSIKGMGPAMMSEILCHAHPEECMLWNRRAYVGLKYLGAENLPRYNYQLTGKKYKELSDIAKSIAKEMVAMGITDANLLTVDYFIWHELQFEDNLTQIHKKAKKSEQMSAAEEKDSSTTEFIHDEVRDKIADIGQWLGFKSQTEIKVAEGSKVDTVWESTIGNMGRVIYVFEVQTKGSIDSLILNLLKSINNPAVQGVVAVSDSAQLEKIKKHASSVQGLGDKLRYWDYMQVLQVHENLESVNEAINSLGLVPQGF